MKIYLNRFNRWRRRSIAFMADVSASMFAWATAICLSSSFFLNEISFTTMLIVTFNQCLINIYCGLYRGVWRFASLPDLIRIIRAALLGTAINMLTLKVCRMEAPWNVYIINLLLVATLLSGARLLFRWLRDHRQFITEGKRILVVGAGSAGEGLMRDLYRSSLVSEYLPIAFVDDDASRHGCDVQGVRILGACKDIPQIVAKHNVEMILIAIPTASSRRMREIVGYCEAAKVPFRTLPTLKNITDGVVNINTLREILLEDLLGREQVVYDWSLLKSAIHNKTIFVTGGGGSIGSELCRQIANLAPANLIIVDHSEFNLYAIDMELSKRFPNTKVVAHLASVTDKTEMRKLFLQYNPDMVFHVAAYKHVPLLETHIRASMFNNIVGTRVVADLADKFNIATFVLISTDKAVNPTSVMGATKRGAEIYCQTMNAHSNTRFITVRFGNVLDSAGSVIPLFRQQLLNGGPITVTHPDITRYFMTIPEAAQLILQATMIDTQAEIFVLDMGEPINIRYLAEQMIKLSGKVVDQDIEIEYTGLRPGEKLFEELFHENESIFATTHPKIRQAKVRLYDREELLRIINNIEAACQHNNEMQLLQLLSELVKDYQAGQHVHQNIHPISSDAYDQPLLIKTH